MKLVYKAETRGKYRYVLVTKSMFDQEVFKMRDRMLMFTFFDHGVGPLVTMQSQLITFSSATTHDVMIPTVCPQFNRINSGL